jgi:NADH:ubiquinone oxidoreductase subunit 2 (subunit N)
MAFVAILTSVISASYYLRIVILLVSEYPPLRGEEYKDSNNINNSNFFLHEEMILTNFHSFLISTITLSILLFILKPSLLLNSTQLLALSLFFY